MLRPFILLLALLAALPAGATNTTPTPTPTPTPVPSTSAAATASAQAAAHAGAAAGVGDVNQTQGAATQSVGGQSITDTSSARAWSLFLPPPAFVPPMAPLVGCAPRITQDAMATPIYSTAHGETDPTDCTLIALRNAKVDSCQYASAKQIEDQMLQKKLPGYVASPVAFTDYTPQDCAALKAPPRPAPALVNYVAEVPKPAPVVAVPACTRKPAPVARKRITCGRAVAGR